MGIIELNCDVKIKNNKIVKLKYNKETHKYVYFDRSDNIFHEITDELNILNDFITILNNDENKIFFRIKNIPNCTFYIEVSDITNNIFDITKLFDEYIYYYYFKYSLENFSFNSFLQIIKKKINNKIFFKIGSDYNLHYNESKNLLFESYNGTFETSDDLKNTNIILNNLIVYLSTIDKNKKKKMKEAIDTYDLFDSKEIKEKLYEIYGIKQPYSFIEYIFGKKDEINKKLESIFNTYNTDNLNIYNEFNQDMKKYFHDIYINSNIYQLSDIIYHIYHFIFNFITKIEDLNKSNNIEIIVDITLLNNSYNDIIYNTKNNNTELINKIRDIYYLYIFKLIYKLIEKYLSTEDKLYTDKYNVILTIIQDNRDTETNIKQFIRNCLSIIKNDFSDDQYMQFVNFNSNLIIVKKIKNKILNFKRSALTQVAAKSPITAPTTTIIIKSPLTTIATSVSSIKSPPTTATSVSSRKSPTTALLKSEIENVSAPVPNNFHIASHTLIPQSSNKGYNYTNDYTDYNNLQPTNSSRRSSSTTVASRKSPASPQQEERITVEFIIRGEEQTAGNNKTKLINTKLVRHFYNKKFKIYFDPINNIFIGKYKKEIINILNPFTNYKKEIQLYTKKFLVNNKFIKDTKYNNIIFIRYKDDYKFVYDPKTNKKYKILKSDKKLFNELIKK